MSEVIGIISIKGGVGKTTTAINLAYTLANDFNKNVLLIDGNFSAPNIGLHLGIVEPETSIHDVMNDKIIAAEALYEHTYNIDLLLGSLTKTIVKDPMKLKDKLKGVIKKYDFIIIDSSPTLNKELLAVMHASDKLLVVTTPDPLTVKMTAHATGIAKEKNIPIMGIILNKVRNKKYEVSIEKIEKKAKTPVLATINDHLKVLESLSTVKPVVMEYPHSKTAIEFKKLVALILNQEYKNPSLINRLKNYIKEDYTNLRTHDFKKSLFYYR
jgi:flagellar biosynthesis protein FlhG